MTTNIYKNTLNMPKTAFKMKANLVENEPKILEIWEKRKIYKLITEDTSRKKTFTIQDGPPYANGKIHLGHALNKILKDIVNKYKLLKGFNINYTPGWDCHGLPIEIQVKNTLKKSGINLTKNNAELHCGNYVKEQITEQLCSFKRLGVLGDWDNHYTTMSVEYKNTTLNTLQKIIKKNQVYQTVRPVPWCTTCVSTLADAEITYKNKEVHSIFVLFEIVDKKKILNLFNLDTRQTKNKIFIVVWTTTPWTIPANQAVALNPKITYTLTQYNSNFYITAEDLIKNLEIDKKNITVLGKCTGNLFSNFTVIHPLYTKKKIKVITDTDVKNDTGTGCLHIAPAHGTYDYTLGTQYNLPTYNCIDVKGVFKETIVDLAGKNIFLSETTEHILQLLKKNETLFNVQKITHSYPYCWRHNTPIVFLATNQCFISMSKNNLLAKALLNVNDNINWYPENSKKRMLTTLENRPDWCISRQRIWGVEFSLCNIKKLNNSIQKNVDENAVLDVWFDSGVVPIYFSTKNKKKADLYIEGCDQYRGWFQTTLLLNLLYNKTTPCKNVITHGFVVDQKGYKMSKTLGNCITPEEVINTYGADVLRLWVASTEYYKDVQISNVILQRTAETYKKIRNTLRYLLGNSHDFNFDKQKVKINDLVEIDKWILLKTKHYHKKINENYKKYKIHAVSTLITKFCVSYLSNFYLDITKNRQYTFKTNSVGKKSAQTATYYLLNTLLTWITPILSFTAEEIHSLDEFKKKNNDSIFLRRWENPEIPRKLYLKQNTDKKWELLKTLKHIINKEIENVKTAENIKSNLEVSVTLKLSNQLFKKLIHLKNELQFIFIVSSCELLSTKKKDLPADSIAQAIVTKTTNIKCPRCWQHVPQINITNSICSRCVENTTKNSDEIRYYA